MDIQNNNTYYNAIYEGIVVNEDTTQDPESSNRVQIFIPKIHFKYVNEYQAYMSSSTKQTDTLFNIFPWATSMVKDLKLGDNIYCGYVDNTSGNYLILGLNASNENNSVTSSTLSSASQVLDLAMPIIISNEVGISPDKWPGGISDSQYTSINPYDNGGWSIGLIQWHHCRAFDVLNQIAQKDEGWESRVDMSLQLFRDLKASISEGTARYRTKYQSSFHPLPITSLGQGIKSMLGSDKGKQTQREYATKDTQSALQQLQGDPYNIQNPAVLIYLLDIMNQYGNGISSKTKAAQICKNNSDTMSAFEEFRRYWRSATNGAYHTRRDKTYSYICNLEKQGKLAALNLVDITGANQGGQLLWPCPEKPNATITSPFGWRGAIKGTTHTSANYHNGVDLGVSTGTKIIAVAPGKIIYAYNEGYHGGAGKCVSIQHANNMVTKYFHQTKVVAKAGATVQAGELIGYSGTTGNSSGPHLHFQLEVNGNLVDPLPYIRKS